MKKIVILAVLVGILGMSGVGHAASTAAWASSVKAQIIALSNYLQGTITSLPTDLPAATNTNCLSALSAMTFDSKTGQPTVGNARCDIILALLDFEYYFGVKYSIDPTSVPLDLENKVNNLGQALLLRPSGQSLTISGFSNKTFTVPGYGVNQYTESGIIQDFYNLMTIS